MYFAGARGVVQVFTYQRAAANPRVIYNEGVL